MPRFRKKPVEIQALQLGWDTWNEMCDFIGVGHIEDGKPEGGWIHPDLLEREGPEKAFKIGDPWPDVFPEDQLVGIVIPTLEGRMIAVQEDWIIKGVEGEIYPCKPSVFMATYEPVLFGE